MRNPRWLRYGLAFLVYLLIVGLVYFAERGQEGANITTLPEALWFSVVTLTTVGYGDYYPVTALGRFANLLFLLGSVGVIGYLISQLTGQVNQYIERKRLGLLGTNFSNHILVIGWDKFGKQVVDELVHTGKPVAIVTNNKDEIDLIHEAYAKREVFALFADYRNIETFEKANIGQAATVFINFVDDTEVLIYLLNLKKAYPNLNYVVSLTNPSLRETFQSAGVRYVVSQTEIASRLVASYTFEPDVAMMAESLMTTALGGEDYDLLEYRVTAQNPYVGHDCVDAFIDLKKQHDCVLVGINQRQPDGRRVLHKNPSGGITIGEHDYLILICDGEAKRKLTEVFGVDEGRMLDNQTQL
ncbi:MAG: potassium channel family protein [Tunicatimonas sp.]